ncbi:MAG: DUF697 domain-containing protein [Ardenticatenaceae bacterium]|nr:DUF697 domain-containing protein [Ardenticatenaceae bacterium]
MMKDDFYEFEPESWEPSGQGGQWPLGGGLLAGLRGLWQWDGLAAEIGQESQARVAFVGLAGVGKSLLFNRLRGWVVSGKNDLDVAAFELDADVKLESLGVFVLADLPTLPPTHWSGYEMLTMLSDPALVVYLVDGTAGVTAVDYRWVAALRASGKPLIVALNKVDLLEDIKTAAAEASEKLGMPIIPISALNGFQVETHLLPTMLDRVPRLAVPLGRELHSLRRQAARRVIRQAAVLGGVVGVQPVPLLDLPFQVMIQVGVVMRVGAAYGYVPTGSVNREVIGAVVTTLGMRYLGLSLVKLIPFIGWAVAGILSSSMTILIGEAAIRYYEAGATIPLQQVMGKAKAQWQASRRKRWRPISWRPRWGEKQWVTAVTHLDDEEEIPITEEITADLEEGAHDGEIS